MVDLYCPRGSLVMDPSADTLTTAISYLRLVHSCISIEHDQRWFYPALCRLGKVLQVILANRCSNDITIALDDYLDQADRESQGAHRNLPVSLTQEDEKTNNEKNTSLIPMVSILVIRKVLRP